MKQSNTNKLFTRMVAIVPLIALVLPCVLHAYPPAPPHTLYGTLRNEFGTPINRFDATVVFEAQNGVRIESRIRPGLPDGVNYELLIPMDAGIAPDLYRPSALRPHAPFQMRVIIGNQTYLPLEMSGSLHNLGEPAGNTRIDLTLGLDSDGDGLPDAWKDMIIAMMGGGLTRTDITPDGDIDGDGMSNFAEYIAGTYAWDANDRLAMDIIALENQQAILEFLAIDGRTYFIEASADLQEWRQVPFHIPAVDAPGVERASFIAPDVRVKRIHVAADPNGLLVYRLGVR